ncbi:chloride channel protein [Mesonia sp. K7]|nr:chloride channel protein [Mesonia sp. K7]
MLSIVIGLLAGLVAVVLKNLTHFITSIFEEGAIQSYHLYLFFIFPFIGLLLTLLVKKYLIRKETTNGISMALFSISKKEGSTDRANIFNSLLAAPLTVGFGGSVGLEGPSVAASSTIGSKMGELFHLKGPTKKLLLVCAAAGSLSAIFKAPIAALLFAIEVFSLDLTLASLLPLLFSSVAAVLARMLVIGEQYIVEFKEIQDFQIKNILFYVVLGLFTALISVYFSKVYFTVERLFKKIKSPFVKVLLGGLSIGILIYFIPPLYGEGFSFINNLISQNYEQAFSAFLFKEDIFTSWVIIFLILGLIIFKPIATAITIGSGGVGGVFAPVLFLGAISGSFFVNFLNQLGFNLPSSNFTMVGMAGLVAGVLHAPLTAMFLIAEITGGYELFIPLMLTVGISFLISKSIIDSNIYTKELKEQNALITHDKDQAVLTLLNLDKIIEKNFIKLTPEMTLREMLYEGVVKSNRNLFPVVNEDEELVGLITLDDIREIMFDNMLQQTMLVKLLMHEAPDYIYYEKDSMQSVMNKFITTGAWNLPVIKDGKYLGFVSKSKMLTAYRRKLVTFK